MTMKTIVLSISGALASVVVLTAREAGPLAVTATLPCEVISAASKPSTPTGLRILRGGDEEIELDEEYASGPYVVEAAEAGTFADSTAHAYFETLAARSDCLAAYSLRNAAQLTEFAQSPSQPLSVTYAPTSDPDPRRQDAAKIVIPADKVGLPNEVRLPVPYYTGGSLLITWDIWFGREFTWDNTSISTYKTFQIASPFDVVRLEVRSGLKEALKYPPALAMVDTRYYTKGEEVGPNVTDDEPLSPQVASFAVQAETWTRYWAYFRPVGTWHEFSLWIADEAVNPVLVIDRLLVQPGPGSTRGEWEGLWFEFATSGTTIPTGRGPLVAYGRNVVMLRNPSDITTLLQRPMR